MALQNEYYAVINSNQKGPFSGSEIEKMITQKEIDGNTFVWCEGMSDWTEAAKVGELESLFSQNTKENAKAAVPQKAKAPAKKRLTDKELMDELLGPDDEDEQVTEYAPPPDIPAGSIFCPICQTVQKEAKCCKVCGYVFKT